MFAFVGALALAGLLALPGAHEFAVFRWLPYSGFEFFLILVPVFMLAGLTRARFRTVDGWIAFLEVINLVYLAVLFPQPLALAFAAAWFHAILGWRRRSRRFGFVTGALLLVPLVLKHNTHEIQFWGLSYATFRAFHLFMDDRLLPELTFRRFVHFTFYFPALLAGPIDRYPRFRAALAASRDVPLARCWADAARWMTTGLMQKFVLGEAVRRYVLPTEAHGWTNLARSFYGYPLYLYLDFAGYSALAIGFSLLVGVSTPVNFDRPLLATTPTEFWRRFHISLGEWLSDYFFKPIYRWSSRWPRVSPLVRQNAALFLTFLAMGLWNGPRRQYVLSGALFGLYSVVHNTVVHRRRVRGVTPAPGPARAWSSRFVMAHLAALALFVFSGAAFA